MRFIKSLAYAALFGMLALLGACSHTQESTKPTEAVTSYVYYEVEHDGRLNIFDDTQTYLSFLKLGETSYRKVRIGAGPQGQTVVFGLTSADKKKTSGIASIDMFDGKLKPAGEFYGEVHHEGRIYVFDN